jgi:hypothetical protein
MRILMLILALYSFNLAADTLIYEAQKKDIKLTDEDKDILEVGEISTTQYVVGGILGTYPLGLGIGHAVQGRWSQKGWIFTAGELGSAAVLLVGALGCVDDELENDLDGEDDCSSFNETLIVLGAVSYVGFRIWEAVDVWAAPIGHNKKVRELKDYINKAPAPTVKSSLNLVPVVSPRMGQGLGLTYIF